MLARMKLLALSEVEHGLVKAVTTALSIADSGAGPTAAIARTILAKIERAAELELEQFVANHGAAILHLQLAPNAGMTPDGLQTAPADTPAQQNPELDAGAAAPVSGDGFTA